MFKRLLSTLKEINPDVVHVREPRQGFSAQVAKCKDKVGFKLIIDQHDYELPSNILFRIEYLLLRRYIMGYAIRKADKLVAVTSRSKKFLEEYHNLYGKRVLFLPLAIESSRFKYNQKLRNSVRKKFNLKKDDIALITLGSLHPIKKIEFIIYSVSLLMKKYPLHLFIVGGGDKQYESFLKKIVLNLGVGKKVHFVDFVSQSNAAAFYSASDIGIWNRASITIIEAMACRLPILIPNDTSMNHLAKHGNGFLFPHNNIKILRHCLKRLIEGKMLRKQMGLRSYHAVKTNYDLKTIAKKLVNIYIRIAFKDAARSS